MLLTEESEGLLIKQTKSQQNFRAMMEGYFLILSPGFQVFLCLPSLKSGFFLSLWSKLNWILLQRLFQNKKGNGKQLVRKVFQILREDKDSRSKTNATENSTQCVFTVAFR